jgi:hypothetical protein
LDIGYDAITGLGVGRADLVPQAFLASKGHIVSRIFDGDYIEGMVVECPDVLGGIGQIVKFPKLISNA